MPYGYRMFPDHHLVVTIGSGVVTGSELIAHARALAADARHDPTNRHLVDLSGVTEVRVRTEDLLTLMPMAPWSPESRRAVVAPRDVAFGMARMAMSLGGIDALQATVVRSMDEARAFLAIGRLDDYIEQARARPDWVGDSASGSGGAPGGTMGSSPVDNAPPPMRDER